MKTDTYFFTTLYMVKNLLHLHPRFQEILHFNNAEKYRMGLSLVKGLLSSFSSFLCPQIQQSFP